MNQDIVAVATRAARQAGQVLASYFQSGLPVHYKGAIDLVTCADMESEATILAVLREAFPQHHFLAEETGENGVPSEFRWVIDPLDGTTNFAHGYPQFSVSIALQQGQQVVLGVVYDVMRDDLYVAERGRGATLNGRPIHVSHTPDLAHSLLVTGFPYDRQTNPDNNLKQFGAFLVRAQGMLRSGSAALDLCAVAAGRVDGYWEMRLQPWDWAAGALMVTEAGGQISSWSGDEFVLGADTLVASNGYIHAEMLAVLAQTIDIIGNGRTGIPMPALPEHKCSG